MLTLTRETDYALIALTRLAIEIEYSTALGDCRQVQFAAPAADELA